MPQAKPKSDIVGLTSLFKSKGGSRVGSIGGEYLDRLAVVFGKALVKGGADQDKVGKIFTALRKVIADTPSAQVMFFLKQWQPNEEPRLAAAPGDPERAKRKSADPFADSGSGDGAAFAGAGDTDAPEEDDGLNF